MQFPQHVVLQAMVVDEGPASTCSSVDLTCRAFPDMAGSHDGGGFNGIISTVALVASWVISVVSEDSASCCRGDFRLWGDYFVFLNFHGFIGGVSELGAQWFNGAKLSCSFPPNFLNPQPQFNPNDFLSPNNIILANNNLMMPNNLAMGPLNGFSFIKRLN